MPLLPFFAKTNRVFILKNNSFLFAKEEKKVIFLNLCHPKKLVTGFFKSRIPTTPLEFLLSVEPPINPITDRPLRALCSM